MSDSYTIKQLILLITMLLINGFYAQGNVLGNVLGTVQADVQATVQADPQPTTQPTPQPSAQPTAQPTAQSCTCPTSTPPSPIALPDKTTDYTINRETVSGVDYGVPIVVSNSAIFLTTDFDVDESYDTLQSVCPVGWRPPTADEYSNLLNTLGANAYKTLTDISGFAGQSEYNYMTSTKSFPQKTDLTDNDTWTFKGIYINPDTQQVNLVDVNTYWEPYKSTKCIMDSTLPIIANVKDLYVGVTYPFSIARSNLVSLIWDYDGQQSQLSSLKTPFNTTGCHKVQVWAKNIINNVLYSCKIVYANNPFGSDGASTLTASTITSIDLGIKALPNNNLFFSPSVSPIAPKPTGGLYVSYVDITDSTLHIIEFDKTMKQIGNKNLGLLIVPMDIIALSWGFVLYARSAVDTNNSFLLGYNSDYSQKFNRTIQNNGPLPVKSSNQITFYDTAGKALDGMQANFAAGNGKLQYGRGRISLIYGRYNYFGMLNVTRNDHTGDAYITFDENGQNEKYSWAWLTSHSLYQAHAYNGQFFATAALGDDYPQNIQVCIVDQSVVDNYVDGVRNAKVRHPKYCTNIVPGSIPGDGKGNSCGRLGGLHVIQDQYAVIYQRKPCRILNQSTNTYVTNTLNELALLTFTFDPVKLTFSPITKKVLLTSSDTIMSVRSGKYGNKILIAYSSMVKSLGTAVTNTNFYSGVETTNYMLAGFDGTISAAKIPSSVNSTPLSDDMKYLSDGTLAWSFIDFQQNLKLFYTAPPPLLQNTASMVLSTGSIGARKAAKTTIAPANITNSNSSTRINYSSAIVLLLVFLLFI